MKMTRLLLLPILACLLVLAFARDSQAQPWQPGPAGTEIALWPEGLAIARPAVQGEEKATTGPELIGGRTVTAVADVTRPTMTIYPAQGHNTGAAIFVYPGGGYQILAIDLEGTDVCDWLTPRGITCVLLKYRVPWSGPHWDQACSCQVVPPIPMALQDAQRAMVLFRRRAPSLGVDPHRIGVLGFSAGGHLVAAMSNATARAYPRVDSADDESSRPDFAIALYPGHLWNGHDLDLYDYMRVSAATPPTMLIQAEDDPVDDVRHSLSYYMALREARVPTELHLYAHGGHAFGLRPTAEPITEWPALVERWLRTIGMVRPG
jgi:acetyl esterase/lipase